MRASSASKSAGCEAPQALEIARWLKRCYNPLVVTRSVADFWRVRLRLRSWYASLGVPDASVIGFYERWV
jgi:hypothetical protein